MGNYIFGKAYNDTTGLYADGLRVKFKEFTRSRYRGYWIIGRFFGPVREYWIAYDLTAKEL